MKKFWITALIVIVYAIGVFGFWFYYSDSESFPDWLKFMGFIMSLFISVPSILYWNEYFNNLFNTK